MVIVQLLIVPANPAFASLALNTQLPLGVLYKEENAVTLDVCPVAPTPFAASAAYVPVKGDDPELIAVEPELLIMVLVKLFPDPPLRFTKLRILPLGARRLMIRSPSLLWAMLKVTEILLMVAFAGIPDTARVFEAPAELLSGIATFTVPDAVFELVEVVTVRA